jgi:hypothetical protein
VSRWVTGQTRWSQKDILILHHCLNALVFPPSSWPRCKRQATIRHWQGANLHGAHSPPVGSIKCFVGIWR